MISYISAFILFAFLASITPGPTNILAFSIGLRAGLKASIPFVIASSASASLILFATFLGIARILTRFPHIQTIMTFAGTLWLSWMAIRLFKAQGVIADKNPDLPTWHEGAFLQAINPKVWMMALTVSSLFLLPTLSSLSNASLLCVTFFIVTCPSMAFWAFMGNVTGRRVTHPGSQNILNKILATLLLITIWGLALQNI